MKKLFLFLLLIIATNNLKSQILTEPKIHCVVNESTTDFTVSNHIWKKLNDSRIYQKLGDYTTSDSTNSFSDGDFIIKMSFVILDKACTVSLILVKYDVNCENKENYLSHVINTVIDLPPNQDERIKAGDTVFDFILGWHDKYMK